MPQLTDRAVLDSDLVFNPVIASHVHELHIHLVRLLLVALFLPQFYDFDNQII